MCFACHNIALSIVFEGLAVNLRQIEVFRAVMLAGSVTGAARLLHVSQPGISRMLAHIELQLGVPLFERGKGRLKPTPEGNALFAEVEQVYRGVSRIEECAQGLKAGERMTLRVLASPSTALQVVPQAIAELTAQFPAARVYLETQLAREMVAQISRQEADIAISTLDIDQPLFDCQEVGQWSLVCVFPAAHRFAQRRTLSLPEVLKEPLIAFSADTPQGHFVSQWCRDHGVEPRSRLEVRAGQAACALAACGTGVAIVDNLTARAWTAQGLAHRPLSRGPRFKVLAVRNSHAPAAALQSVFVQRVRANLRACSSG